MAEETPKKRATGGACGGSTVDGGTSGSCAVGGSTGGSCAGSSSRAGGARRSGKERDRARLERIWSREMALQGLIRIYETALEGARTEVRDENGALVEVKFNPTAANAATKAIEAANKMLGYTAPEEEGEEDLLLTVSLGDAEEFAV